MADIKDVVNHIRAAVDLLFVRTYEEQRFVDDLLREVKNHTDFSMEIFVWSAASGLENLTTQEQPDPDCNTPEKVLGKIAEFDISPEKSGAVFILKDFNQLLLNSVPRRLKDLISGEEIGNKRIIILSPELNIGNVNYPAILDKETVVLDYDLLTSDQLLGEINSVISSLEEENYINADLEYSKAKINDLVASARGLTQTELSQALSLSLVKDKKLDDASILNIKKDIVRKKGILEYVDVEVSIDDVGGLDVAKKYIDIYANAFSPEAKERNVEPLRGLMLTGIAGTGKSLLAKTCASVWHMPCLRLDVGRIMSGVVGSSESNIREALKLAEATEPCVLWIDEIEKSISGVKSSNYSDSGTTSRVFGTLLTWMQENTADVVVITTANDITQIPPEFIRRFDEVFFVDLPAEEERKEIFKIHLKKRNQDLKDFNLDSLVGNSKSFTGAEIEKAIRFGLAKAFYDGADKVTTEYIIQSLKDTKPISCVQQEEVDAIREWAQGRARYASTPPTPPKKNKSVKRIIK